MLEIAIEGYSLETAGMRLVKSLNLHDLCESRSINSSVSSPRVAHAANNEKVSRRTKFK
jgi:hypothetical protein